ncbi:MAG TPA: archaemetzincin [Planctomycetota bacterium]|jgi:archaemetzincin|nr:archaemetzincin [Planctomycetota bacterium]
MPRTEEGFERLAPPRNGEWRSLFQEPEQTFEDYVAGGPNRPRAGRKTFVLQPLGEIAGATLDRMVEYAAAFFGLEARRAPARPLFEKAYVGTRAQYNSSMILGDLAEHAPADAVVTLGVSDVDLFARGKKFVFGEGSLDGRAGIFSLARLEGSERRALKLLTHEAGHLLSLAHCVTHRCVMQGSNSLEESDGHPLHLCPDDLRKLEWNVGLDRRARYRTLEAFYRARGWEAEAHWIAART